MRVLHVGKALPPVPGGIETYLGDLLRAQASLGLQVAALVHRAPGEPAPDAESFGGASVYTCASHGQLLYAPISPGFPLALHRAIHDFAPDVLHLHVPNTSAFAALLVPAARRLPWVLHWHNDVDAAALDWRLRLAYPFYRPLETALLRRAACVVTTSLAYQRASMALRPWQARCEVIPLGVDLRRLATPLPAEVEAARREWPASGDAAPSTPTLRVLAVGRLAYYKGFEVLIEAMGHLPGASLLVVGDGPMRGKLERRIGELGLQSRVRLMGSLHWGEGGLGLAHCFAACDVMCLPSLDRSESFGLVLLEAMRYGCPMVASDIPGSGVSWVVKAGGGRLVAPGDSRALASELGRAGRAARTAAPAAPARPEDGLPSWCDVRFGARQLTQLYSRAAPHAGARVDAGSRGRMF